MIPFIMSARDLMSDEASAHRIPLGVSAIFTHREPGYKGECWGHWFVSIHKYRAAGATRKCPTDYEETSEAHRSS